MKGMSAVNSLDDQLRYANLDRGGIGASLDSFPAQCGDALYLGETMGLPGKRTYDHLVFCGVGGSAIGADFLRNILLDRCVLPITVQRDYHLPVGASPNSLVILCSYSGETEETYACYRQATELGATRVIVAAGGPLLSEGRQSGATCCQVPGGYQPRMAMFYLSLPILVLLRRIQLIAIDDHEFCHLFQALAETRRRCMPQVPCQHNEAKKLAAAIEGKVPVIWGSIGHTDVVAKSWKNQINENAKAVAWCHTVPEANHNEITGFQNPGSTCRDTALLFLRDAEEEPAIARRFEAAQRLLSTEVGLLQEHWGQGRTKMSRLAQQIYFGNYVSYYLAILYGVDPADITPITRLKRMIQI